MSPRARIQRLWLSFGYALEGIRYLIRTQPNLQIHLLLGAAAVVMGLWLGLPAQDWALIVICIFWVISAEGLNTGIELAIDRFGEERHPISKAAKDVAAGAVLLTAMASALVGLLILGPPLWERLM